MNTPRRTVRVDDDTWDRARARAADEGEPVSAVVVRALRRYGRPRRPPAPPGPPNVRGAVPLPGLLDEYVRLNAEREILISQGVDPADLAIPLPPPDLT